MFLSGFKGKFWDWARVFLMGRTETSLYRRWPNHEKTNCVLPGGTVRGNRVGPPMVFLKDLTSTFIVVEDLGV